MPGALLDLSNPFIPFVGGALVGVLLGVPVIDFVEGLLGMGGGEGPEAGAAYAYHAEHMGGHPGMHGMHGGQHMTNMLNMFKKPGSKSKGHKDFEKEYQNIEQTYTNHIFIKEPHPVI